MLLYHQSRRMLVLLSPLFVGCLIVLALLALLKFNVRASHAVALPKAQAMTATASATLTVTAEQSCLAGTAVPARECLALLDLYTKTQGLAWFSNTNWLAFDSGDAPCDWYGVSCSAGQVTALQLARNQLSGTLALSLGELRALTTLHLENNQLIGRVPPTLCRLPNLQESNFVYNGLFTRRHSVESCLATLDPAWQATQTTAVTALRVTQFYTDALQLAWTPILYRTDGGYYEIATAPNPDGPYTVHGQTADKHATGYLLTGLAPGRAYFVRVRTHTPPHGDQPSAVMSNPAFTVGVTKAVTGRVLLAAYFPADNDLATEIRYVVERMRLGTRFNPNVQVVLLVDGRQDGDTRVLEMANGQVMTTTAVQEQWQRTELDTADPAVLTWFLHYARNRYPAERTVVSLIGHGLPVAPEINWEALPLQAAGGSHAVGEIPPLPKEHEASPSDVTNRGYMSTIDVGQALLAATDNGANPFDVVFFDQCFQGSLDLLYEVHQTARVLVASPNYAWLAAAYDKYLAGFTPTSTPAEMATLIINRYEGTLDNTHPNAIFWVRSNDIVAIGDAVSTLGDALRTATAAGQNIPIAAAMSQSSYVDTTQCSRQNMQLGPPDELVGLESMAKHLLQEFGLNDPYGIASAINQLRTPMLRIQTLSRVGSPYLAPQESWNYSDTLTVLAPLPRNSPSAVAWRASIYRSDAPFTATWSIDPTQPVTVTASLAYPREGRWDEFLAEWFTNLSPTVGAWCNYMPPTQVLVEESDVLTLTAALSGTTGITIEWTPTDDTSAVEYRIDQVDPYAIGWETNEIVSTTQTAVAFADLSAGSYRFRVLARNADNEFVAQSNEAVIVVPPNVSPTQQLFLPLVQR